MKFVYDLLFRRTSTYFVGIMASVFFFERAFDLGSEAIYDNVNRGVSYIMFRNSSGCSNPILPLISETMEGHQTQVRISGRM